MLITFLVFVGLVALAWGLMIVLPSQRRLARFTYGVRDAPSKFNGSVSGDDVRDDFKGDPEPWPAVTAIVPGRNEGHHLARTLGSLCGMEYPKFHVVFIDDQSTDDTAAVCRELAARHPHLTVIRNTRAPEDGWVGKSWAVHQAEALMHAGDYLLFADADLVFHRDCLKQMMRLALHRRTDITSSLPALRCETLGELLGILSAMVIVNARLSLDACNDPRDKRALVAGGFLLVKRATYETLGGHAAVRGQMVEDVALGTRAKARGYRVFTTYTHDLYEACMYEGWRDTYRGLKKNAYAGANYRPWFGAVIMLVLLLLGVCVPLYAVMGMALAVMRPGPLTIGVAAAGVAALLLQLAAGWRAARVLGMTGWAALTLPAGFAFYLAVFMGSVIDYYSGGNTWAGRRVAAGRLRSLAQAHEQA